MFEWSGSYIPTYLDFVNPYWLLQLAAPLEIHGEKALFFFVVNRVCTAILTLSTVVGGENSTKKKENRIAKSKVYLGVPPIRVPNPKKRKDPYPWGNGIVQEQWLHQVSVSRSSPFYPAHLVHSLPDTRPS